jgi:hypothetical protein
MGSLIELILRIISLTMEVSSGSGDGVIQLEKLENVKLHALKGATRIVKVLRILRIMRIIRLVKVVQFLPRLTFDGTVLPQTYDLVLNLVFPATAMLGFCLLAHLLVGESLKFRCVPADFNSTNVINNKYYQDYGVNYFYSQYNVAFCGYKYVSPLLYSVPSSTPLTSPSGGATQDSPVSGWT